MKLPMVVSKEVTEKSSDAGKAVAAGGSKSDGPESKYSRSMSNDQEESMDSAAALEKRGILTGGEAMLCDMPNKDDTTLAKRKTVQSVMQDRSLSALERNEKIQDIMAGKVVLPRVVAAKEPASMASRCQSHQEKRNAKSPERKEYSRRNDIHRVKSRKGVYSSNINDANEAETQGSERVDSDINDSWADVGTGENATMKDTPDDSPNE